MYRENNVPPLDVRSQMPLWADEPATEDPAYLSRQLITYIGNKRSLLGEIGNAIAKVKQRLGKRKLRLFDAFSGSGVVSRLMKAHASSLVCNDLEDYAAVTSRCYLRNRSTVDLGELARLVDDLNARVLSAGFEPGFIEELYAPKSEESITPHDRVFYTKANARRLDNYRRMMDAVPATLRDMLMAPLLSRASVHANTAGVFKGFYKNTSTKIGQYGGSGRDALLRIKGEVKLDLPVLSNFECDCQVHQGDTNEVARHVKGLDMAYIDPPYNQHPYGSNYFMLNLLANYRRPSEVSRVSGIPVDWRRSGYNTKAQAQALLWELLQTLDAPYLLISFNNEGFIPPAEMQSMLRMLGSVDTLETRYNAYRGSRNLSGRPLHVTEQLFLVERA